MIAFLSLASTMVSAAYGDGVGIYSLQADGDWPERRRRLLGGWRTDDLAQSCAPAVLARSMRGLDPPAPLRVLTDSAATARDMRGLGLEPAMIDARLVRAVAARRRALPELSAAKALTLYKVELLAKVEHEWACFVDLDAIFLRGASLARFLSDPAARSADLLACSAGAPLNAGLFCARPRRADYEQLLALVANGSFSHANGWEDAGPVSASARARDPSYWDWYGRFVAANAAMPADAVRGWRFTGADIEQGLLYHHYGRRFARPFGCAYAFERGGHFAHEPAPLGGGGLLHHFLGNGKPWQNRLFASPADARAYDRHHEGRFCEWWALLASWRRQAGGASRNSTCWRAFEAPGKFSVSTLSTHARALCPAGRRGRM